MNDEMNNNGHRENETDNLAESKRYALDFACGNSRAFAASSEKYSVGDGDFTAEAWVCTNNYGTGTVLSKKGKEGGFRNGGFLLVIKPDGVIKFATDDGYGFYEINTISTNISDGSWHHILATRKGSELYIYLDFKRVAAHVRTNRYSPLNIDSQLPFVFGATDQVQEPYNRLGGKLGEIRFWNISKTYKDLEEWATTDQHSEHLCGCWTFFNCKLTDYSGGNDMKVGGERLFVEWSML